METHIKFQNLGNFNILLFRHVQGKDTQENSSMGQGVRSQRQSDTGLAHKACFKGSVESNMGSTLGQKCRDENVIDRTQ